MTSEEINKWADYWYYQVGINIIPVVSKYKTGKKGFEWKQWQFRSIPEDLFVKWKAENAFADGIGVLVGKVWRGVNKGSQDKNVYLIFIDCDNSKAIKEFCTRNGVTKPLEEIAQKFLVEQHLDNPNKCHIYFYSDIPFPKKSSDALEKAASQSKEEISFPLYEIKGMSKHGLAFATPSMHESGHRYQIIGTPDPVVMGEQAANELLQHIDSICRKYGISYIGNVDESGDVSKVPMESLYDEDIPIMKGNNRHEGIMRLMESMIRKNRLMRMPVSVIKRVAWALNEVKCEPPLDNTEMEKQWKSATEFMAKKLVEEDAIEEAPLTEKEEEEQEQIEQEYEALKEEFKKQKHNLEIVPLHQLGLDYAGKPVCTSGSVIGISGLVPDWSMIRWKCKFCGQKNRADKHDETKPPKKCRSCDSTEGYIEELDLTIEPRINQQAILIQEGSETLPCFFSGRQEEMWPVRAGQKVQALGIQRYKSILNKKMNQKEWIKYFRLLAIKPINGLDVTYTDQDIQYFKELASMPQYRFIEDILVPSFAPHVKGNMDTCKLVCIYALGSQGTERPFNVILLGPPAKGKTQLTEYTSLVSHSGNLTEFIQTTTAGLISETVRDPITGANIAKPGILATYSVCCFTDMNAAVQHKDGAKLLLSMNHALEHKVATSGKAGGAQAFEARSVVVIDSNNYRASWDYEDRLEYNLQFAPKSFMSRIDLGAIVPKETTKEQHREIARANYRTYRHNQNPVKLHEGDWADPVTGAPRLGFESLRKFFFYMSQQPLPDLPEDEETENLFADNYVDVMEHDQEFLVDGRYNRTSLLLARVRAKLAFKEVTSKEDLKEAIAFVNQFKNIEVTNPKTGERDANYMVGSQSNTELEELDMNKRQQWDNACRIAAEEADEYTKFNEEPNNGYFAKSALADILISRIEKTQWRDREEVFRRINEAQRAGEMLEDSSGRVKVIKK